MSNQPAPPSGETSQVIDSGTRDCEVDVLVVGSGAGALTAAITASENGGDVMIIEKTDMIGGTTATSGGAIWVPCSHLIEACGEEDSPDDALNYLIECIGDVASEEHLRAYIEQAPQMVKFMERRAELKFSATSYSDYYPDLPGARLSRRTLDPEPFDAGKLGDAFGTLRPPHPQTTVFGFTLTIEEAKKMLSGERGSALILARLFVSYLLDIPFRLKTRRHRRLTLGNALVGCCLKAVHDRSIPIRRNTALEELVREGSVVRKVIVSGDDGRYSIAVRKGVIIAAGGFESNPEMRAQYLPPPTDIQWSGTPGHNTGDAIIAAQAVGAKLKMMDAAWYAPSVPMPDEDEANILFAGRASPGVYIVNGSGKRFLNEAANYDEVGQKLMKYPLNSWLVFDATARKKYALGPLMPSSIAPDSKWSEDICQIVNKADTIEELASLIGVDQNGLKETQSRTTLFSRNGVDEDFGKGANEYDCYYGDPGVKPNPCLAPLERPPFYAIQIFPGDIGTKGGIATDIHGQALDEEGEPIEGLFAIGNSSASIMGRTYPGAGATIGPAMTFGFTAARRAMRSAQS